MKSGFFGKPGALLFSAVLILFLASTSLAQPLPKVSIGIEQAQNPGDVAVTLQIVLLLTLLSLAPAIIVMVTSFTRIVIVFSFLRHALGTQQAPPSQVLIGLAIFLSVFIMSPVWKDINEKAFQPYMNGEISQKQAIAKAADPVRDFMFAQTREKDLALFINMANLEKPDDPSDIPTFVLIPSFIISEFRIAFQIGFLLYIPFLVLDMVIASVLMSMGMMMLPPVMISLPFKLLLFVLVDGWYLIVGSIAAGFH
ncbi:flagellar biosynthetic protein FliP [candidate division KSB1 bacterium RBG_16_48_16]|nr:MAG: flagellar biosynthetic protein FliP [candidate division KSB1 bacterium RBG_16_48_16]